MKYFNYLRNILYFYSISGIVLGLAIFSSIIVYRYNNYLTGRLQAVENISNKKETVKNQIHKIDSVIKYLKDDLNLDLSNLDGERLIFQTLDSMKTNMQDALITITTFEEKENQKRLPVEIKASVYNYKNIVDYIGYIESLRVPEYRINQLSISKGEKGDIILDIKGVLIAPSFNKK